MNLERVVSPTTDDRPVDRAWDLHLMHELASGQETAAELLMQTYEGPVFRFIWRRVAPARLDAEELLQDTFMAAVQSARLYDGKAALYTWLCGIARHKIADHYRRIGRQPAIAEISEHTEADLSADEPDFTDTLALREAVETALFNLPEHYRDLLRQKYELEKTAQEIARQRGTTLKAVESLLARARKAFSTSFTGKWDP